MQYFPSPVTVSTTSTIGKNYSADTGEEGKKGKINFRPRASNLDPETGSPVH